MRFTKRTSQRDQLRREVVNYNTRIHEEVYLSWDEITSVVASDRDVLVNGRKFVRVCSCGIATELRETLLK